MVRFFSLFVVTLSFAAPSYSSDISDKGKVECDSPIMHLQAIRQDLVVDETSEDKNQLQLIVERVVQPVANSLWRLQQLSTAGAPLEASFIREESARAELSNDKPQNIRQDLLNGLRAELLQSVGQELIGILRQELLVALSKELTDAHISGSPRPLSTEAIQTKDDVPAMEEVKPEVDRFGAYSFLFDTDEISTNSHSITNDSKSEFTKTSTTSITAKEIRKAFLRSTVHPDFRCLISPRIFKELFGLDYPELEADFIKEYGSYEDLLQSGRFEGILDSSFIKTEKAIRDINDRHWTRDKKMELKSSVVPISILRKDKLLSYLIESDRCYSSGCETAGYSYHKHFHNLSITFTGKPLALPPHMAMMKNLRDLCLAHNHLKTIPHVIYKMTRLAKLDLSDNELVTFSADISDLRELQELNLSNNKLENIPVSLSQCRKLRVFDLNLQGNPKLKEIWDRDLACFEAIHGILSRTRNGWDRSDRQLPYETEEPLAIVLRSLPYFYQPDIGVKI
jgi:hypothetical protein